MAKKSNHKHQYVRHLQCVGRTVDAPRYEVVDVCSICGKVHPIPYKEHMVKVSNGYRWLHTLEDYHKAFGDLPMLNTPTE